MFPRILSAAVCTASLAACATPGEPAEPIRTMPGESTPCIADDTQRFIGQSATQSLGEQIMIATKARIFQWVAKDSAVTMDYRPDRVRVTYDDDMKVLSVRCG